MKHHYEDNLFVQERHHCAAKPHPSHLWLHLQSLRTAQSLFDHAIVLYNIPWRERERDPNRCRKKERHKRADESLEKTSLGLHHNSRSTGLVDNSRQDLFLHALLISSITVDVVVAAGCWLYLRRRAAMFVQSRFQPDCLASRPRSL